MKQNKNQIESDYEYKNSIVEVADKEFLKSVKDYFDQYPELNNIFQSKMDLNSQINILLPPIHYYHVHHSLQTHLFQHHSFLLLRQNRPLLCANQTTQTVTHI